MLSLLAVPSCIYSFWHGVIPTSYFIFNDFYTCFTNFLSRLSARRLAGEMMHPYVYIHVRMYAHAYSYSARARSKTEVVTSTCNQDKMASV